MATPNLTGITTVTPGQLNTVYQLASGDNVVYTVGASQAAKLTPLILTNVSAATVTVSVSVHPAGSPVDGTHKVLTGYSLAVNESITVDELAGMWLGAGQFINVNVSAGAAVDAVLTGLVFS